MKKRETYIQIASDRLVLAVRGPGGTLRHVSAPITLNQEPAQWIKELNRLSGTLRELAESLGVEGASATVLYIGPTQAVSLESLPIRSTGQAIEAAKLSCLEKVSYTSATAVGDGLPIGRDGTGDARRVHVAVAVDRDDVLGVIARFVEDAGLRFVSALPIDAPIMASIAGRGLHDHEPTARLYIGEHSSLFFISSQRSLLFARRITLGVESIVNVLTRPIRVRSGEEPVTLSEDEARAILHTHGVPDRDTLIHENPELRGVQIIPVLQPVLQRIVVELRQSLRFSLPDDVAGTVPIVCLGPGSRLPGLSRVIAAELGVPLADSDQETNPGHGDAAAGTDDKSAPADMKDADSISLLADAVRDHRILRGFGLLPTVHALARQRAKLQRWLWAGAAAALVMVAIDGFRHHTAIQSLSSQKATMISHHSELDSFQRTSAVLAGALSEMSRIERRVSSELGEHFDGYAAMAELSDITPESIRLSEITFRQLEDGVRGTIAGIALYDANKQTSLKQYIESLRGSPLFSDAVLGNVQISRDGDREGERFQATLTLTPLPPPHEDRSELYAGAGDSDSIGGDR